VINGEFDKGLKMHRTATYHCVQLDNAFAGHHLGGRSSSSDQRRGGEAQGLTHARTQSLIRWHPSNVIKLVLALPSKHTPNHETKHRFAGEQR